MEIWITAENAYNERVSRVKNQILRDYGIDLGLQGMPMRCSAFSPGLMPCSLHGNTTEEGFTLLDISISSRVGSWIQEPVVERIRGSVRAFKGCRGSTLPILSTLVGKWEKTIHPREECPPTHLEEGQNAVDIKE